MALVNLHQDGKIIEEIFQDNLSNLFILRRRIGEEKNIDLIISKFVNIIFV